jgi:hypothetical protein
LHFNGIEMKTATRLQLSPRARAARLVLGVALLAAWAGVVLTMFPREREVSSVPGWDRTAPALRHSIPPAPVRV